MHIKTCLRFVAASLEQCMMLYLDCCHKLMLLSFRVLKTGLAAIKILNLEVLTMQMFLSMELLGFHGAVSARIEPLPKSTAPFASQWDRKGSKEGS